MGPPDPALSRVIDRIDQARAHGERLAIRGGGTKAFYGGPVVGQPLELGELAGVSSYEPTELVVTVRAGTPLAELESVLTERGQCLPFEPPRFAPGGTVGGMVAAGLAGPARAYAGSVRDHVLGVTVLDGNSELLTFGGQVAKNVAGYDVSRVMAGSLGILGVICEVSLKVLPAPRSMTTVVLELDERGALERLAAWASKPLGLSGSAWHAGRLSVRTAGAPSAVDAAAAKLGGARLDPAEAASWWTGLRDHGHAFFGRDPASTGAAVPLWRVSVPAVAPPLSLPGEQWIEWHGALRWWRTPAAPDAVRAAAAKAGGHATLMRGGDRSSGVFTPVSDALMDIHRRLKRAFDPAGLFNRDRLYAEL
jgi:FAD/FMN-containing dehydrogenase